MAGAWAQTAAEAIHLVGNQHGFGTRARALGGAYTALGDDYSAIYWNPAGLGYITDSQFYMELSNQGLSNTAKYVDNSLTDDQSYTNLSSIGMAIPLPTSQGSMVLALGYNQISDFNSNLLIAGNSTESNGISFDIEADNETLNYSFDSNVERLERVDTDGGIKQLNVGGAIALSPAFMAGLTIGIFRSGENYSQRFEQYDIDSLYNTYPGDFDSYVVNRYLDTDFSGLEFKLGGSVSLTKALRLGGTITLPATIKVTENHSFDDRLTFDDGYENTYQESGQFTYRVKNPFVFNVGAALNTSNFALSFSARYCDWSQVEYEIKSSEWDSEDYTELMEENTILKQNYQATIDYHLGAEIKLPFANTTLRAGYAYIPEPELNSANAEKFLYSTGLAYQVDRNIDLNVTYSQGSWQNLSSSNYTPEVTTENIESGTLIVGLTYSF